MSECRHKNLILLKESSNKLRCRICHLTINAEELGENYCPECYETSGKRQYDFESVKKEDSGISRYRCEDCGIVFEA